MGTTVRHESVCPLLWLGAAALLVACGSDETYLLRASVPLSPAGSGGMASAPAQVSAGAGVGGGEADAGPPPQLRDAAPSTSEPKPDVVQALPCELAFEWQSVEASGPGCASFSAAFEAHSALWDGASLTFNGGSLEIAEGKVERLSMCGRGEERWRFHEIFTLEQPLPSDRCPAAPFTASYAYSECPFARLNGPCIGDEPTACTFRARLLLKPQAAEAGQANAGDAGSAALEPTCAPVGTPQLRSPRPLGAPCSVSDDCVADSFCSRANAAGGCSDLGEGTCQAAPQVCDSTPAPVCLCDGTRRDDPALNPCRFHAAGISTVACP